MKTDPSVRALKYLWLAWLPLLMMSCTGTKTIRGKQTTKKYIAQLIRHQDYFTGIKVVKASDLGKVASFQSDKLFTPASNTKLLTFYVADQWIADSIPSIKYCEWNDTIYFTGTGDPGFLHPDFPTQKAFQFLNESKKTLAFVPQMMIDDRFGPGWAWDDYPFYFQAEKSTFPMYGNCLWVQKDSSEQSISFIPKGFDLMFEETPAEEEKFEVTRDEFENNFRISYSGWPIYLDKEIPFLTSNVLTMQLLQDTLRSFIEHGTFPEGCEHRTIYNYTKDSLFEKMLVDSDNLFAEQLLLSTSYLQLGLFDSDSLINYTIDQYFPQWKDNISWRDGSGLSRYNKLSPDFLVDLLVKIYQQNDWERIVQLFPDNGKEGTLKSFLSKERPFVFAKTGSMTGVYNVSGYLITQSNEVLIFSIMNNNFTKPAREVKKDVEELLLFLRNEY